MRAHAGTRSGVRPARADVPGTRTAQFLRRSSTGECQVTCPNDPGWRSILALARPPTAGRWDCDHGVRPDQRPRCPRLRSPRQDRRYRRRDRSLVTLPGGHHRAPPASAAAAGRGRQLAAARPETAHSAERCIGTAPGSSPGRLPAAPNGGPARTLVRRAADDQGSAMPTVRRVRIYARPLAGERPAGCEVSGRVHRITCSGS